MRTLICFTKKEFKEYLRSAKSYVLTALFVVFGVLNPLFAKLIPFLFKILDEAMSEMGVDSGLNLLSVSDIDSWVQFYENAPLYMIIFIIMMGNVFTKEYGSTLILVLTKGVDRYKILASKTLTLFAMWTVYYLVYFGSTYFSTYLIFDAHLAQSVGISAVYLWLAGLWMCSLVVFFSTLAKSMGTVLAGTLGLYFIFNIFAIIPKIGKFLPVSLMGGTNLIYGTKTPDDFMWALAILLVSGAALICASVPLFNKKQI